MIITNQKGIDLIKEFEGFEENPYLDTANFWTVGYGHKLRNTSTDIVPNYQVTEQQAEELLKQDLIIAETAVNNFINIQINENQFAALVSFTFNLGRSRLMGSTLKQKVNAGLFDEAAEQFERWSYSNGEISEGLLRRRKAEKQLFLLPV